MIGRGDLSLYCGNCGKHVDENDRFCRNCGARVTVTDDESAFSVNPETVTTDKDETGYTVPSVNEEDASSKKIYMGNYESEYDTQGVNADFYRNISDEDLDESGIYDREKHEMAERSSFRFPHIGKVLLVLILIVIGLLSFWGVRAASNASTVRAEKIKEQEELRKAEEEKKKIEAYLILTDEFINSSVIQVNNFNDNMDQLPRLSAAKWLKKFKIGKAFDALVDKFVASGSYTSMTQTARDLDDSFSQMADPPEKLKELFETVQSAYKTQKGIVEQFTENLEALDQEEIRGSIDLYTGQINDIKSISQDFR